MIPQLETDIHHLLRKRSIETVMEIEGLSLAMGSQRILDDINLNVAGAGITTLIGPSGAGKSSLLRCLNGLNQHWQGSITLAGRDVRRWRGGWDQLRRQVGLIAQKPCVFPQSIRANTCFGLQGWRQRRRAAGVVESALRQAALWEEVHDRLDSPAESLSQGQQQRLCIARALAVRPGMLLLDEPTASLDPRSKQLIEQSLQALAQTLPVIWVTHDLDQARRLGGEVVFMCDGRVMERADSETFFNRPQRLESREFLRWHVCECD